MKVLYICRVFTGLESSLADGVWAPTGVPTIYKVMEGLAASPHDVSFVLAARGIGADYDTGWQARDDCNVTLENFQRPLRLLAGEGRLPAWLGRFRGPLTTWRHIREIRRIYREARPDLVYVDRAHVLAGAILARREGARVLFRVMGVYPSMWDILRGTRMMQRLERWAYRAPFAQAICTQDGSGGEYWMEDALDPSTARVMMMNGREYPPAADTPDPRLAAIPGDKTVALFVGRLEWNKGAEPFVEAILALPESHRERIHAVIVGTGAQQAMLKDKVAQAGADGRVTFIDRLPHAQIRDAHARSDIYVSLNRLGQLSNANLEVMSGGHCMVISDSRPENKVDIVTRELIPDDAVVRVPTDDREVPALVEALVALTDDPDRRTHLAANLKAAAATFIPSWEDRVADELALIENLCGVSGAREPA